MAAVQRAAPAAISRPRRIQRSTWGMQLIALIMVFTVMCSCAAGKLPVTRSPRPHDALMPAARDGAFATIFYDHGADSADMLLAIRVLMRSIRESKSIYRRIVIVPSDGLLPSHKAQFLRDDPAVEIVRTDLPNVFKQNRVTDPRAQLLHMRNKLVLWDDPTLSKLQRVVYLDPENLLLSNLDEIFACTQFCAVDNGQSVVYSSSVLVISPESLAARNLYSDAIDAFMISGRAYNYVGISQGFLPGIFEAMEESPLFILDGSESQDAVEDGDKDSQELEDDEEFKREASKSVVRRLPFFYSINHMVFYERLNWDLYKCKDKGTSNIPGPLLSFKYSGATIKPWNWVAYAYFQVNWHWMEMRDKLEEDHFGFFIGKFVSLTVVMIMTWVAYVAMCLKLRNDPSGRKRRLSSWGFLPVPNNAEPLNMDFLNSRVVRKACQFSCNVLYAISSTPIFSSIVIVFLLMWTSVHMVPTTMHPHYAAILWAYLHDTMLLTVLIVYDVAHTLRTATWRKEDVPSTGTVFALSFLDSVKRLPAFFVVQYVLLRVIGRTDWFRNPVLRPTVLISLIGAVCIVQVRVLTRAMRRVALK